MNHWLLEIVLNDEGDHDDLFEAVDGRDWTGVSSPPAHEEDSGSMSVNPAEGAVRGTTLM